MGDRLLTIGEAAALYGLAPSTLRWWERKGLLDPVERRGGQRRYGAAELRRIGLIHIARNAGLMRLDQIATLLAGTSDRHWHETVQQRIRDLDQQIERLVDAREALAHTLRCPAADPTRCRRLDELLATVLASGSSVRNGFHHELGRDETGAAAGVSTSRCGVCRRPLLSSRTGRPRSYCSRACQQRAYRTRARLRHRNLVGALPRRAR